MFTGVIPLINDRSVHDFSVLSVSNLSINHTSIKPLNFLYNIVI